MIAFCRPAPLTEILIVKQPANSNGSDNGSKDMRPPGLSMFIRTPPFRYEVGTNDIITRTFKKFVLLTTAYLVKSPFSAFWLDIQGGLAHDSKVILAPRWSSRALLT